MAYLKVVDESTDGYIAIDNVQLGRDAAADSPCDTRVTCSQPEIGEFACSPCPEGYVGNPIMSEGPGCEEVNICTLGEDSCHDDATCIHTGPGTHDCDCNQGFTGSGQDCYDLDECDPNEDGGNVTPEECAAFHGDMAACQGLVGCLYDEIDTACTVDMSLRVDNPCNRLTKCSTPEFDMFVCTDCPPGYTGNGNDGQYVGPDSFRFPTNQTGCIDIDECDMENDGYITVMECMDQWKERHCLTGVTGNEHECIADCEKHPLCKFEHKDIKGSSADLKFSEGGAGVFAGMCLPRVNKDDPCDPLTSCSTPEVNAYVCTDCPTPGYRGNGADEGGCEEVNPCTAEAGSGSEHDCDPNSLCDHTGPGEHSCWCNFGYEGPGKVAEGGCTLIDQCDPARNGNTAYKLMEGYDSQGYMYNKAGVQLEYEGLSQEECKDMCSELGDDICFGYTWRPDSTGNDDVRAARCRIGSLRGEEDCTPDILDPENPLQDGVDCPVARWTAPQGLEALTFIKMGGTDDGPCDPVVACTNGPSPGYYECGDCPVGYSGTGAKIHPKTGEWLPGCVDINECDLNGDGLSNPCVDVSTCSTPELNSYECSPCPSGYTGEPELENGGCQVYNLCDSAADGDGIIRDSIKFEQSRVVDGAEVGCGKNGRTCDFLQFYPDTAAANGAVNSIANPVVPWLKVSHLPCCDSNRFALGECGAGEDDLVDETCIPKEADAVGVGSESRARLFSTEWTAVWGGSAGARQGWYDDSHKRFEDDEAKIGNSAVGWWRTNSFILGKGAVTVEATGVQDKDKENNFEDKGGFMLKLAADDTTLLTMNPYTMSVRLLGGEYKNAYGAGNGMGKTAETPRPTNVWTIEDLEMKGAIGHPVYFAIADTYDKGYFAIDNIQFSRNAGTDDPCDVMSTCSDEFVHNDNTAYSGEDVLVRDEVESWAKCAEMCMVEDVCEFWSYTADQKCRMKGTKGAGSDEDGTVSGIPTRQFKCEPCPAGYNGNGLKGTCMEENPCLDQTRGGCHAEAACTHTAPGENTCTCNTGFSGDGVSC
jgi:hypothetical protein